MDTSSSTSSVLYYVIGLRILNPKMIDMISQSVPLRSFSFVFLYHYTHNSKLVLEIRI